MIVNFRDLRYVCVHVDDLSAACSFAADVFGLQLADHNHEQACFRSDARNVALRFSNHDTTQIIALSVARAEELTLMEEQLKNAGYTPARLTEEEAAQHQVKAAIKVTAPNGVEVEIVWRPMTSGWPFYGAIDAGIDGLQSVSLATTTIAEDEKFWTEGIGLCVSDWAGDAVFLQIDDAHHAIALYPSPHDKILGVTWAVKDKNNIMANWYRLQKSQVPIIAGPGRQPTSNAIFVTVAGPGGILYSYAAEMDCGPEIVARGPRQFPDNASSHCMWGSQTNQAEFLGSEAEGKIHD